jgi:hypothetical protein
MSALYMSISANEGDLQIEDELAKGRLMCTPEEDKQLTYSSTKGAA